MYVHKYMYLYRIGLLKHTRCIIQSVNFCNLMPQCLMKTLQRFKFPQLLAPTYFHSHKLTFDTTNERTETPCGETLECSSTCGCVCECDLCKQIILNWIEFEWFAESMATAYSSTSIRLAKMENLPEIFLGLLGFNLTNKQQQPKRALFDFIICIVFRLGIDLNQYTHA